MGREVRRVPPTWVHPLNTKGDPIPLHGRSYKKEVGEWDEAAAKWAEGFELNYLDYPNSSWVSKPPIRGAMTYAEWAGEKPVESNYMPDFPAEERTHYQMYEDTTEGTPISPIFATPEELARWLADTGASAFGNMTATYEQWLRMIVGSGSSGGMVIKGDKIQHGVGYGEKP